MAEVSSGFGTGCRRPNRPSSASRRLVAQRNEIRSALGDTWWKALLFALGNWLFDYFALVAAITATGSHPRPTLVLLAYSASMVLAMIPITPGGLGFVEAGLTGLLALAGVSGGDAVIAVLAYRLVSFWLPLPLGGVAASLHRRRYRGRGAAVGSGRAGSSSASSGDASARASSAAATEQGPPCSVTGATDRSRPSRRSTDGPDITRHLTSRNPRRSLHSSASIAYTIMS